MLRNFLIVAFRNLSRNKVFVLVNALGLGISLACCIAAYLWIAYDREFDDFHRDEQVSNIYKLHSHWDDSPAGQNILTPFALAPLAAEDLTGIEMFTRYYFEKGYLRHTKGRTIEGIAFADAFFFEMFNFPTVKGDLDLFKKEQYMVISHALALKLFRNENPLGQTVTVTLQNEDPLELIVAAVIENIPHNTSFTFDAMIRVEQHRKVKGLPTNSWQPWPGYSTFFKIDDPDRLQELNDQMQQYIALCEGSLSKFQLEHFKADFTMSDIMGAMVNVRMWQTPIRILIGMALLIFMIACFNLANTSFTLMARRLREIGIRKTMGASNPQIFMQFLIEICITVLLSLLIGLLVAQYIVPTSADLWAEGIGNRWDTLVFRLEDMNGLNFFIAILLLSFTGISIAGIYPALVHSKSRPIKLLKNETKVQGTHSFNRLLLVFQFSISLLVLISGIIFVKNYQFMMNKEMGYDVGDIVYIQFDKREDFQRFSGSIEQLSGVESIAGTNDHLGLTFNTGDVSIDQRTIKSRIYHVGKDYMKTMGFKIKYGRGLLETDHNKAVIVTAKFSEQLPDKNPVGKTIKWEDQRYTIVGVVEDVVDNWYMLNTFNQTPQLFFQAAPHSNYRFLTIKTSSNADDALDQLEQSWDKLFPYKPFQGNSQLAHLQSGPFQTSYNLRNIFIFLTVMTVLLSCVGIYSLAALNIEKRSAEMGIRKVLGASVSQLVQLLNREFVFILLVSVVIGSTTTYKLFQHILNSDFKVLFIEVDWTPFLIASVSLIIVGVFTSGSLILKAALQSPVKTLKKE